MELNPQLIDDSIGSFKKVFNEDVLATFTTLAQTLKEEEAAGGNAIITQALDACRKFQDMYNTNLESFRGFCEDGKGIQEIAEYLEKADMGSVAARDTSYKKQGIDADAVRM
jgi:hypothetical protein